MPFDGGFACLCQVVKRTFDRHQSGVSGGPGFGGEVQRFGQCPELLAGHVGGIPATGYRLAAAVDAGVDLLDGLKAFFLFGVEVGEVA
ncbi:MAG: hypothetical protein JZU64_15460 [Rhodoferax sp.]|nr:hypothetical protein [Rhodoferax sp.]